MFKAFLSFFLFSAVAAYAGEPEIAGVDVEKHNDLYTITVGVKHADEGWNHYVDKWIVRSQDGRVVAERNLNHPHTNAADQNGVYRKLSGIKLPAGSKTIKIEVHDTKSGWSRNTRTVDLPR